MGLTMARTRVTKGIAEQVRDLLVQGVTPLVFGDADPERALKVNSLLQNYMKSRLLLLQYLEERKPK